MPVREAVKRLAVEDIVTINPRSNCMVKIPTQQSMLNAFEMREVLELYAIKKIFRRVGDNDLSLMKEYLEKMEGNMPVNNTEERMKEYVKYDQLFHQEFCVLTRNMYLLKTYRRNMLHLNIAMTFRAGVQPDMEQVSNDHRMIFEHLRNNSRLSVTILKKHLKTCKMNMINGKVFNSLPE